MNKNDIQRARVENIKRTYPPGTRIELISMSDPYAPVPSGTKGTVSFVDDMGTIHPKWDNGRSLGVIVGEDAIAKAFMSMSEHKRMTFKAVLQRENPRTLDDVIDRARNIDAYELETSAYAEPDFFKLYLMYHLESRFDPKWIEPIVADEAEQQLLRQLKAAVTDYGVVSSANSPLYRLVPYYEPDESYELIEILDKPALFSNGRISESDLPEGLYKYDLRSGDETDFVTLEKSVMVNHAGTVILKEPLDFGDKDYIPLDDDSSPNFTGERMTLDEFQQRNFEESITMGGM